METKIIRIKTQGDIQKASQSLKRIHRLTQQLSRNMLRDVGTRLEKELRNSAFEENITPFESHNLNIEWKQKEKGNSGELYISQHLITLDEYKSVQNIEVTKQTTKLLRWSLLKGNMIVKKKATLVSGGILNSFTLKVKPRPFILRGWQRTRRNIPNIIKKNKIKVIENV